jgi:hypothetical protein
MGGILSRATDEVLAHMDAPLAEFVTLNPPVNSGESIHDYEERILATAKRTLAASTHDPRHRRPPLSRYARHGHKAVGGQLASHRFFIAFVVPPASPAGDSHTSSY